MGGVARAMPVQQQPGTWGRGPASTREQKKATRLARFPMLPWNDPFVINAVLYFSLAGGVIGTALLACEYLAKQWTGKAALAVAGVLAAVGVTAAWGARLEITVPCALLGAFCGLSSFLRSNVCQQFLHIAARPAVAASLLLVVSLAASRFVQSAAAPEPDPLEVPLMATASSHPIEGLVALTDQGRALSLIAYDPEPAISEIEQSFLAAKKYEHQIIRLAAPSPLCNCHGWIYTAGRFALRSSSIDELLLDNGYAEVSEPKKGDLVIYRGRSGNVEHTGVVRLVDDANLTLVESKWGPLGVYLHPVDAQPYGETRHFYRSSRVGHLVTIVPESSLPDSDPILLAVKFDRALSEFDGQFPVTPAKTGDRRAYERPILRVPGQRKT